MAVVPDIAKKARKRRLVHTSIVNDAKLDRLQNFSNSIFIVLHRRGIAARLNVLPPVIVNFGSITFMNLICGSRSTIDNRRPSSIMRFFTTD